jgi:hypothetical protein
MKKLIKGDSFMTNIFKSMILLFSLLFISSFHLNSVDAAGLSSTEVLSKPTEYHIERFLIDNERGYIYANANRSVPAPHDPSLTINEYKLLIIDKKTLTIIKALDSVTGDMEMANGKLYMKNGVVFDLNSQKKIATLNLGATNHIEVIGTTLYYVNEQQKSLYKYNLTTNKAEKVNIDLSSFYLPAITRDDKNNVLYVSETLNIYDAELKAYSLNDLSLLGSYKDKNHYYANNRTVHIDNGNVYFNGERLASKTLTVLGNYVDDSLSHYSNGSIQYVKDRYIFTPTGIYDRDTSSRLSPLTVLSGVTPYVMDNEGYLYLFVQEFWGGNKIKKTKLTETTGTQTKFENIIPYAIKKWEISDETGYIYALGTQDDVTYLLFIRADDLTLESSVPLPRNKTINDLEYQNGKIFLAGNPMTVYNANTKELEKTLSNKAPADRIELDGNKLYFADHTHVYHYELPRIYQYDLETNKELNLETINSGTNRWHIFKPEIALDREKDLLYVTDQQQSKSTILSVNTKDFTIKNQLEKAHNDSFQKVFRGHEVFFYHNDVFFNGHRFDGDNVKNILGNYQNSPIYHVKNNLVATDNAIYDIDLFEKMVTFNSRAAGVQLDKQNNVYTFNYDAREINSILKKFPSGVADSKRYQSEFPLNRTQAAQSFLNGLGIDVESRETFLQPYFPIDVGYSSFPKTIDNFIDAGIIQGFVNPDTGFITTKPKKPITRAEFVAILVRSMNLETTLPGKAFTDVKEGHWSYEPIRIASALGIIDGTTETTFSPGKFIRRDEIAKMVVNAFQNTVAFEGQSKEFQDVPTYWAKTYIEKASAVGIVNGVSTTKFDPYSLATREQAFVMIERALFKEKTELPTDEELKNIVSTFEVESIKAMQNGDISSYNELISQYTAGYYNALHAYNSQTFQHALENNITVNTELTGTLNTSIVEKNNRYAILSVSGAEIITTLEQDGQNSQTTEELKGTMYLTKDMDGNWKIYRLN